jgi:hypothetical protein
MSLGDLSNVDVLFWWETKSSVFMMSLYSAGHFLEETFSIGLQKL